MIRRKQYSIFILLAITLIGAGLIYLPFVIKQIPYEFVTIDTREENYAFYNELIQLFDLFKKNGTLPFYSWSDFLGTNFFVSKMWYIMTDIPMLICAWFKIYFWDALIFTTIFKMMLASLSMYLLLGMFSFKESTKIIGAFLFAFSAGVIYYSVYPIFLLSYSLLPLYLYTVEKYLQEKQWIPFCIMTFLIASISFYYFFAVSFFLPIYYIYRYYLLREDFKKFLKETLRLIGCYLIGVCLSGIILCPVIFYLSQSSRVGHLGSNFIFRDIRVYLTELASFFLPMNLLQPIAYPFNTNHYPTREIFLWAGSITVLLLPQVFILKDKKLKKANWIFIFIEGLFLVSPLLLSAMHGFSEISFRGFVLFVIVNLIMLCHTVENADIWNLKLLRNVSLIAIGISALIVPVTCLIFGLRISDYLKALCWGIIYAGVYLVLYMMLKKKKFKILWVICFFEMTIFPILSHQYLKDGSYRHSYQFMNEATHVLQDKPGELKEFLNQIEPVNASQYYRVYVPQESVYWSMGLNSALYYQINGLTTYDSIYEPSLTTLVNQVPEIIRGSSWYLDIQQPHLMNFLNVKYAIVTNEMELPENMNWRLITDNFRGFLCIYRNDDYRSLGTSYSQVSEMKNDPLFLENISNLVYCTDDDLSAISGMMSDEAFELENIRYEGNQLTGTIDSEKGGFLILSLPYNEGWNVKINGNSVVKYKVNAGFIGLIIPPGNCFLEMYFTPAGLKQGAVISISGFVLLVFSICFSIYQKYLKKASIH